MCYQDIAFIVFASVTANHLGLVRAIEQVIGRRVPVAGCPKCLSCWLVAAYLLLHGTGAIETAFLSLLSAYAAVWLELLEGIVDRLYGYVYGKVFTTEDTADDDQAGA